MTVTTMVTIETDPVRSAVRKKRRPLVVRIRTRLGDAAADLCASALGVLSATLRMKVKQRMALEARLDYAAHDLFLTLHSPAEYPRVRSCAKEPETVRWLAENMRPGAVLYDIGANIGPYSLVAAAMAAGRCRVYAFEPVFSSFAALCENILRNGFASCIVPVQVALAARAGEITLELSSTQAGAAEHRNVASLPSVGPAQRVLCSALDDVIDRFHLPVPNLIKLDVDGPELDVLHGAATTLGRPELRSILVEVDETTTDAAELTAFVARHGFREISRHPRAVTGRSNVILVRP